MKEKIDIILEQIVNIWIFHVWITWWEPLIKKNIVYYLLDKLKEKWLTSSLNSNIMLLTKEIAENLNNLWLISILTSLTSFDEKTHDKITWKKWSYKKVIKWIQTALDNNIKIWVNMVVTKLNSEHVYKTWKFLNWLWVKSFYATKWSWPANIPNFEKYAADREDIIQSLNDLVRVKKEFWMNVDILECYPLCLLWENTDFNIFSSHKCTAWITSSTIWCNWDVRPCTHANMSYWNIFNESMADIWKRMKEWRTWDLLPIKCWECSYLSKCTWGCRMEASWYWNIKWMDPYAKPENRWNISKMLLSNKIKVESLYWKLLRMTPTINFRQEKDWCVISIWFSNSIVTNDSWILLKNLLNKNSFTIEQVAEEFWIEPKVLNKFFFMLSKKKFIEILDYI